MLLRGISERPSLFNTSGEKAAADQPLAFNPCNFPESFLLFFIIVVGGDGGDGGDGGGDGGGGE